jgi:hypothetical protein
MYAVSAMPHAHFHIPLSLSPGRFYGHLGAVPGPNPHNNVVVGAAVHDDDEEATMEKKNSGSTKGSILPIITLKLKNVFQTGTS